VSPDGKRITGFELSYRSGITTRTITLTLGGEGLPIGEDGSFDVSLPDAQFAFHAQFSEDGTKATGSWEADDATTGKVSAEWEIGR